MAHSKPNRPEGTAARSAGAAARSAGASPRSAGSAARSTALSSTDWGDVARWYDALVGESGSEFHRHVVIPGVLRLMNAQPGQRVLDLACGQGVLCRILHQRGVECLGVDAARPLIEMARQRSDPSIRFQVGDARELGFVKDNQFDAAACVLAIQNIHPIQPVFEHAARTLRPLGRLVIVMMHPCFRGSKHSSWGWDVKSKEQYRRVDRYLLPRKHPILTRPGAEPEVYTWTFHKPIEAYVKALRNAGLLIDAMEEWPSHKTSQPGPRASAENTARKEIPMFLAIRAIKVNIAAATADPVADDSGADDPAARESS